MIDLAIADDVAEITLHAPDKLNALSLDALGELDAAYGRAADAGVRALMLRGEGRAFCAGRDISGVDATTDDVAGYLEAVEGVMRRIAAFPAPTFAAVQGACLGVGLGLAIATDVVYVAKDAKIGSPFVNLGAMLDSGGHALLYERLGAHRTLDLIYTGELMTGTEAVSAGLFSRVVPGDELLAFTRERAARAAAGPDAGVPGVEAAGRHPARRAAVADRRRGEPRSGGAAEERRLPRGFRRVPGQAQADLHRGVTAAPVRSSRG